MVSSEQINEYYTNNHKRVCELTSFYIHKYKRYHIDKLAYVNESYLYIVNLKEKIEPQQIESYVLMFIKNNLIWNDGKIYKQESIKENFELNEQAEETKEVSERDIKLDVILDVYQDESDQIKKIVHEVALYKEQNSCRKMADHFNIDKGQANKLINQLKIDINEKFKAKRRIYE